MFRVLLLGVNYQLSDRELQFQLLDRRAFKRFVGLRNDSDVPDQKTIWKYRHRLAASGRTKERFEAFEAQLREAGYALTGGRSDRGLDDGGSSTPAHHSRGERGVETR